MDVIWLVGLLGALPVYSDKEPTSTVSGLDWKPDKAKK